MRRVILLFVIISMCIFVGIAGTFTFLESDSVLKQKNNIEVLKTERYTNMLIDELLKKIYLISGNKIIKSFPMKFCKSASPLPAGNWMINYKYISNGNCCIIVNTIWGKYGIHGKSHPWSLMHNNLLGCISVENDELYEIYKSTGYGTQIKIFKPYNLFLKYRILKSGDIGWDVFEVQNKLKKIGLYKGNPNGVFDEKFKKAVHEFQRINNLEIKDCIGILFYNSLNIYII